ncbi:hypothetical protein RRG08_002874 [Elysia crispata]|nr:hypothetical protein RRG08_002874 [Elysia crispata]
MKQAFLNGKTALANAAMLVHPCTDCPLALTSDASDVAVGAVLEQFNKGHWQPLAFFSRQLRKAEIKYSAFDRELLGVYLAIRHFRFMLEGRNFTIYTDHKPLVHAMAKTTELWSARQQRHLSAISEFSTDIAHVSGKNNIVADCLSRSRTTNAVSLGIDYIAMVRAQAASIDVQAYKTVFTCLEITNTRLNEQGPELVCDVSTGRPRPIIPPDFRRTVFDVVHNLSHPGVKATVKMVSEKFVWHGMRKQVKAIPLRGITTPECVHALITGWIARFGVPGDISSDRGSQFTSSLWTEIAARLGVKLHHTSAYHPQANGMIERFHRTLKTALKARLIGPNWVEELPWVLLGLRTTPKEDLGYSSAELVYGEPLTIPGELVPPKSAKSMDDLLLNFRLNIPLYAPLAASHHTSARTYLSPSLLAAKHVYVRRDGTKGPLQRPYSGPYAVLTPGDKTFLIDIGGRAERISVDRIKPAFFDPFQPVILAKPPPRGRPPAKQSHPSRSHPSDSSTASKHQQAMSRPAVQTSSRTGRTIRPPMRYQ